MLPLLSKLSRGFRPPLTHDGLLMESRIFDTLSTLLVVHSLYTYFVTNFGDLAADALILWSYLLEYSVVLFLAFTSFGLSLYITVHLFRFPQLASLSTNSFQASVPSVLLNSYEFSSQTMCAPVQVTASACDISITLAAVIWYLRSKKSPSGWRSTAKIIDTLILYAVCRGILTA
ncbi:hypothetical protein C8J57DRAFT_1489983 [Mycena rebaudengoi]|nr:hypothetical protein C8J57DRAFT_1489983 [Mycena rebaudengoi]